LITPLITIGVTSFNAEDTIALAIGSALGQTWRPTEIIVVDDASRDSTRSVIGEIAQRHENIRLIANARNVGVAVARNEIIAQAKGAFIVFFDDDDVSHPERVARQFCRITAYERDFAHGAPVICHTAREQIYPNGSRRIERTMGTCESRVAPSGLPVASRILMGTPVRDGYGSTATCSQMARTDVYRTLGGFHPAFQRGEDTDFCVRLALAGGHFPGIAQALVIQTMTKATNKTLDHLKRQDLSLLEKHRNLIEDDELYHFCRDWTDLKFRWLAGKRSEFFGLLMQLGMRHPLLTLRRLRFALPSVGTNRAFRALHRRHAS
jgi:glycosyltransferase involved in cell wall biosynthesis